MDGYIYILNIEAKGGFMLITHTENLWSVASPPLELDTLDFVKA